MLKQNVSDFCTSRNMQTTELCKQIGVPPPGGDVQPGFNPYASGNFGGGPAMNPQNMSYQFF